MKARKKRPGTEDRKESEPASAGAKALNPVVTDPFADLDDPITFEDPGMRAKAFLDREGLSPRQLYRLWIRGKREMSEFNVFNALMHHYNYAGLYKRQNRTLRAEDRLEQSWWLLLKRREYEDGLEEKGLPRECWRQMWWDLREEPEPLEDAWFMFAGNARPFNLAEWLRDADGNEANEVYWLAGGAWAAHNSRLTRRLEWRVRLGRILEVCSANLKYPSRLELERIRIREEEAPEIIAEHARAVARRPRKRDVPHIDVIKKAKLYLTERGQSAEPDDVLALLTGEIPDEIGDAIDPVLLADYLAVEENDGRVFFRFANRNAAEISRGRFDNIVRERIIC